MKKFLLLFLSLVSMLLYAQTDGVWRELFNGKNFNG